MLIHHGNIIRDSRIPPRFILFNQVNTTVAQFHLFTFVVPDNRDFLMESIFITAKPSGAEGVADLFISINGAVIEWRNSAGAAVRVSSSYPQNPLYLPAGTIIYAQAGYSAGVTAKRTDFTIIGYTVPSFDKEL
jgi:hypothetical protein